MNTLQNIQFKQGPFVTQNKDLEKNNSKDFLSLNYFDVSNVLFQQEYTYCQNLIFLQYHAYLNKNISINSSNNKVTFPIRRTAKQLNCSSNTILKAQNKFEQQDIYKIHRTKVKNNLNSINQISIKYPDHLVKELISNKQFVKKKYQNITYEDIKQIDQPLHAIINEIAFQIYISTDLFNYIFCNDNLSNIAKANWFKIYTILYLRQIKNNSSQLSSIFSLAELQKELQVTRKSFYKILEELEEFGLLKRRRCFTKNHDTITEYGDYRYDKSLWTISLNISDNDINPSFALDKSNNVCTPKLDVFVPQTATINKRYIIKEDKEKIDKKEKQLPNIKTSSIEPNKKSLSIFYNLFNRKKKTNSYTQTNKSDNETNQVKQKHNLSKPVLPKIEEHKQAYVKLTQEKKKNTLKHIKCNSFDSPKKLIDLYPICKADKEVLASKSGKNVSLDYMNKILSSITSKMAKLGKERIFRHKGQFIKYFSLVLKHELKDEDREIESYFAKIEDKAIYERSDFNQLKAKLINTLPKHVSYPLVKNMIYSNFCYRNRSCDSSNELGSSKPESGSLGSNSISFIFGNPETIIITLMKNIDLQDNHRTIMLNDIKAVYGNHVTDVRFKIKKDNKSQYSINNSKISSKTTIDTNIVNTEYTDSSISITDTQDIDLDINHDWLQNDNDVSQLNDDIIPQEMDITQDVETNSLLDTTQNIRPLKEKTKQYVKPIKDDTIWGDCLNEIAKNNPGLTIDMKCLHSRFNAVLDRRCIKLLAKPYSNEMRKYPIYDDYKLDNYQYIEKIKKNYLHLITESFEQHDYKLSCIDTMYRDNLYGDCTDDKLISKIRKEMITDQSKEGEDELFFNEYDAVLDKDNKSVTLIVPNDPDFVKEHWFSRFKNGCERLGYSLRDVVCKDSKSTNSQIN